MLLQRQKPSSFITSEVKNNQSTDRNECKSERRKMNREGSILTIAAAIFLSWFVFRKSLNKKNKNPNNRGIPPPTSVNSTTASTAADLAGKYEVFLSYRSADTGSGFTDFLYTYLVGAGIRTFRDDNELRIGEKIGPDLLKAIEDSKVSIPIFSKNYASSKWCLREFAKMVECQTNEGRKIFPIFYDVDAYDVRNQRGSYEKAFRQHEKNLDEKTVQEWRQALKSVVQLKGYELKKETNGHEGELVKKVVRNVLLQLKKNYTHVPDDLVGMDHHVAEMTRLLHVDSNGVRIVGIHGMGGIGKTTIAKVIYNQLCKSFEHCCFLEDVREKAKQHHCGLVGLQRRLVSQIQKIDLPDIVDVDDGINRIKDAVHRKEVVIVLDDVDDKSQFDKLAGECSWFDKASRIIVTTRNKEVLNALEVTYRKKGLLEAYKSYEPELMNPEHSLELFSKYAFMRDSPPEDYLILSKKVVSTAAGLPLVLVTLGSLFFGNEEKDLWEEKVRELEKIPHEKVQEKLRISFDALTNCQKRIFLDIACLFVGEDKENPYYMWDDCEFYPRNGTNTLVLRSLVKVGDDNTLRMHDQLRDLGRQIVREENWNEPGKRSRVWRHDEALDVLKGGLGTKYVEALNLDFGAVEQDEFEQLESHGDRLLVGEEFDKLRNLRFLRVGYANLGGDFKNLFSNLRWLQWSYRGKFIPTNFHLKNLVILDLSRSHSTVTDDWEGWSQFKMAKKLKVLNLSYCKGLSTGPNFSTFTTLERLILRSPFCREINPSLANLRNLRVLDLVGCKSLKTLDCSTFEALDSLDLHSCESLGEINGLEKLESLTYLNISFCRSLERLPNLSNLKKLKELVMRLCPKVPEVEGVDKLESLKLWNMRTCVSIKRLPNLSNLRILKELNIRDCSQLREVEEFGDLDSLETLDMRRCKSLERLPDLSNLKRLKTLCLSGCKKLHEVEGLGNLESLESLDLSSCGSLEKTLDLSNLKKLKKLGLSYLEDLAHIMGLEELESLESLDVSHCKLIEKLPDLSNLKRLKHIYANECEKLAEILGLEELKSLTSLDITGCKSLENLPLLPNTRILQMYKDRSEYFGE